MSAASAGETSFIAARSPKLPKLDWKLSDLPPMFVEGLTNPRRGRGTGGGTVVGACLAVAPTGAQPAKGEGALLVVEAGPRVGVSRGKTFTKGLAPGAPIFGGGLTTVPSALLAIGEASPGAAKAAPWLRCGRAARPPSTCCRNAERGVTCAPGEPGSIDPAAVMLGRSSARGVTGLGKGNWAVSFTCGKDATAAEDCRRSALAFSMALGLVAAPSPVHVFRAAAFAFAMAKVMAGSTTSGGGAGGRNIADTGIGGGTT